MNIRHKIKPTGRLAWRGFCLALSLAGCLPQAFGEAERQSSMAGEGSSGAGKKSDRLERYNFRIGPAGFSFSPSLAVTYSDNVYFTEKNPQSDFIIYPQLGLGGYWPITELNSLSLKLGAGTAQYIKNSDLNRDMYYITPDSELAWNFFVKDFKINFHERFSYQDDVYSGLSYDQYNQMGGSPYVNRMGDGGRTGVSAGFSGTGDYGGSMYGAGGFYNLYGTGRYARFENTAGFTVDWDLKDLVLTAGYDHHNTIPNGSEFAAAELSSEQFYSRANFHLNPQVEAGLEARASINQRAGAGFNDSWSLGGGPFVNVIVSPYMSFRLGGGYETYFYDSLSDNGYVYAYGQLNHQLNEHVTHGLNLSRQNRLGLNANNLESTSVGYSVAWKVIRDVSLSAQGSVTFADESGGQFKESFNLYQAGLSANYQLTEHWRTFASYSLLMSESDLANRSAVLNRIILGLAYKF